MTSEEKTCSELEAKIRKNLDRIRVNRLRMTPEMRIRYHAEFNDLKHESKNFCRLFAFELFFLDLWAFPGDEGWIVTILTNCEEILNSGIWQKICRTAERVLMKTCCLEDWLDITSRIRIEIRYKAYGPYWVSKTRKDRKTGEYRNTLVDAIQGGSFRWNPVFGQWEDLERRIGATMLPPTQELLNEAYLEEVRMYENWENGRNW